MIITGKVKKHSGRGKGLGFPTANIDIPNDLADGIYTALTRLDPAGGGMKWQSLVFIGANVTFGETERRMEVYILDFDEDIYNQEIEVEILKKIRDNKKFDTPGVLIEQMKDDERVARDYFARYNENVDSINLQGGV